MYSVCWDFERSSGEMKPQDVSNASATVGMSEKECFGTSSDRASVLGQMKSRCVECNVGECEEEQGGCF